VEAEATMAAVAAAESQARLLRIPGPSSRSVSAYSGAGVSVAPLSATRADLRLGRSASVVRLLRFAAPTRRRQTAADGAGCKASQHSFPILRALVL